MPRGQFSAFPSPAVVNGIYQNTVYGLAAKLPFKYTGAVVLGSVRSGQEFHTQKKTCEQKFPRRT